MKARRLHQERILPVGYRGSDTRVELYAQDGADHRAAPTDFREAWQWHDRDHGDRPEVRRKR